VVNNFLFEVTRLFTNPQINGSTRKEKLAEYKCIVETTILRSTDLISAALSDEDFDNLINLLKDHHFELNHNGPILYKGRNYGRALLASR